MLIQTIDDGFNYDDLRRFIVTVAEGQDILEFRALGAHGAEALYRTAAQAADPDEELRRWLEGHNAVGAVYVGPNPQRSIRGGGHRGVGTDDDVALARCLFADFDNTTREAAEAAIKSCGMPAPSLLIATRGEHGDGWHAYWRLAEPLSDMTGWRACQGRLIGLLGSDPTIKNPSRIMRAPGSFNHKRGGACRIVAYHDERYALDTLPVVTGAAATGVQPVKPSTPPGTGTRLRGDAPQPIEGPSTPVQKVLAGLARVGRSGNGWSACCPAHDDRNPSLSISEGDDGRVLLYCHAGCAVADVVGALGLEMADLSPAATDKTPHREPEVRILSAPEPLTRRSYATAGEAIAVLDAQLGGHTRTWTYHDADLRPVGMILRWDTPEGKQIRPVSHNADGWFIGAMPGPCPLYHLPSLKTAARVYVCEGEKAADAAAVLGFVATTSAGGSQAASKTDWSPLAGKDVVILPDHDEAGDDYAARVVELLSKLSPAPTVRVLYLPDLPEHGDVADFLELRGGDVQAVKAEIESLVDQTQSENLQPSRANSLAFQPFPIGALPDSLRTFVTRVSRALGCDPSFVVLPLLSALASAIGNTRVILLKHGWAEPAIVWTAIVGDPGTLKSPALDKGLRPVRVHQREAFKDHEAALPAYRTEKLAYERDLKDWKRGSIPHMPREPEAPVIARHVCDDTTVEALAMLLRDQPRGLLMARDELAGWLAGFDRYAQGKGGDVAKWLEMFGGRPLTVDRKTGDNKVIYVPRAAVSVTGGIQPETLRRSMGDAYIDNGLASRLLFAMPPVRVKRWTEDQVMPADEEALARLFAGLYRLRMDMDGKGEPVPRVLGLTDQARAAWVAFYNDHAREQSGLSGELASVWSKLEGYTARFALIIELVRCVGYGLVQADPRQVDAPSIEAGIAITRWFGHEARRVYARLRETDGDRERRTRVDVICAMGGSVSVRDWQRKRSVASTQAGEELKALADAGYGSLDVPPRGGVGRPGSMVFTLHQPRDHGADTDKMPLGTAGVGILSEPQVTEDESTRRPGAETTAASPPPSDKNPGGGTRAGVLSEAAGLRANGMTPEIQAALDALNGTHDPRQN